MSDDALCTAFEAGRKIAAGPASQVAAAARAAIAQGGQVLVFDDATGRVLDLDLREGAESLAPRRPGRPKLGVEAREVTLLPRRWDWLAAQPGGASAALRRLVEAARRENVGRDAARQGQEAAYRFMTALAGDAPGYEESVRALFAANRQRFVQMTEFWPPDVRDHARRLAEPAFVEPLSPRGRLG